MDTMEEQYHSMNHRLDEEGMNREDSDMGEDMTIEVVKREHEGVMLMRHWTDD
jgi:hypothetical protein